MAYLGLVPSERSTGDTVRRGSIIEAGNGRVRHMLVECAWTYRHPPRFGKLKLYKLEQTSPKVRQIAWMSNGAQSGPPIGAEKGPLFLSSTAMRGALSERSASPRGEPLTVQLRSEGGVGEFELVDNLAGGHRISSGS